MLLQMALFHYFLQLSGISFCVCVYTTCSLFIHLLMDIQVASVSWLCTQSFQILFKPLFDADLLSVLLAITSFPLSYRVLGGLNFVLENSLREQGNSIFSLPDFYSVQFSSVAQSCLTLCDPMNCSMPGLPVHHQLPEFTQTHVHRVGDAIQPFHPLSSPSPPAPIPPSIRVFSNESTLCMRWSKYWSFSFSIIPSKEIPGLISFRMDWVDLLAVQGTLKSLLQHHSSKASILRHSALFTAGPTLTSIHNHWKNHSLDQMGLCWQSNVSAFESAIEVGHNFSSKE